MSLLVIEDIVDGMITLFRRHLHCGDLSDWNPRLEGCRLDWRSRKNLLPQHEVTSMMGVLATILNGTLRLEAAHRGRPSGLACCSSRRRSPTAPRGDRACNVRILGRAPLGTGVGVGAVGWAPDGRCLPVPRQKPYPARSADVRALLTRSSSWSLVGDMVVGSSGRRPWSVGRSSQRRTDGQRDCDDRVGRGGGSGATASGPNDGPTDGPRRVRCPMSLIAGDE